MAATAEDTVAYGIRLAQALPRDIPATLTVFLYGDLGAGKTTFARGFLRGLDHDGPVRSPTYTLIETYVLGTMTVVHADLYRLQDPCELESLGLRDLALPDHVWLIEWPQRAGSLLPEADLSVTLTAQAAAHGIDITASSAAGEKWLTRLNG